MHVCRNVCVCVCVNDLSSCYVWPLTWLQHIESFGSSPRTNYRYIAWVRLSTIWNGWLSGSSGTCTANRTSIFSLTGPSKGIDDKDKKGCFLFVSSMHCLQRLAMFCLFQGSWRSFKRSENLGEFISTDPGTFSTPGCRVMTQKPGVLFLSTACPLLSCCYNSPDNKTLMLGYSGCFGEDWERFAGND